MKNKRILWTGILSAAAMLVIILDTKTALTGAEEGISLCLRTVIPSLYPFFIFSSLVSISFAGRSTGVLRPLCRVCGIPDGAESLMLLGFVGGYPVGARSVYQAYQNGILNRNDAERMLGFCNNAGPAFLFGMVASLFSSPLVPWVLLAIQILTAVLVAILLPNKSSAHFCAQIQRQPNLSAVIEQSIKTMAVVCGWVILFRIIVSFIQRWFLWLLTPVAQVAMIGLLELSNGCYALQSIPCEGTRFLLSALFLSLGGLCVTLQTMSIVGDLGLKPYISGKILQGIISFILASMVQYLLFRKDQLHHNSPLILIGLTLVGLIVSIHLRHRKKVVAFLG